MCYGDGNLAFIANDWHTALLPVYLKAFYRDNGLMKYARSVLVIHNIAHQVSSLSLLLAFFEEPIKIELVTLVKSPSALKLPFACEIFMCSLVSGELNFEV